MAPPPLSPASLSPPPPPNWIGEVTGGIAEWHNNLPTTKWVRDAAGQVSKLLPLPGPEEPDDTCYLLSHDPIKGSFRSLECLGLLGVDGETSLPAFPAWGFLSPSCWSYVRVKRNSLRPPTLSADWKVRQLAEEAAQEWSHPELRRKDTRGLRVAVRGRCVPFLLDDLPWRLSQGRLRRDALASTVTKLRGGSSAVEERRITVIERVVVDGSPAVEDALRRARELYPDALNPVVTSESDLESALGGGWFGGWGAGSDVPLRDRSTASLLARQSLRRLRRGTIFLGINAVAIVVNILVAARAVVLWHVVEKNKVIEWIQRAAPHAETTIVAVRGLSFITAPIRQAARGVSASVMAGLRLGRPGAPEAPVAAPRAPRRSRWSNGRNGP